MNNKTYFIGDLHLDHTNIIAYCNRPFSDAKKMNEYMIKKWNDTISPEDTVYYLGDISYGRGTRGPSHWLPLLNGNKILIKGNHDRDLRGIRPVNTYLHETFKGINFLLIHSPEYQPHLILNNWVIHGHHHNNNLEKYPLIHRENKTINVSADILDYKPLELKDLLKLIKDKEK